MRLMMMMITRKLLMMVLMVMMVMVWLPLPRMLLLLLLLPQQLLLRDVFVVLLRFCVLLAFVCNGLCVWANLLVDIRDHSSILLHNLCTLVHLRSSRIHRKKDYSSS